MQRQFRRNVPWLAICLLGVIWIAGCGPATGANIEAVNLPEIQVAEVDQAAEVSQISTGAQSHQNDPAASFETVMSVLTSPRCINCHPIADRPRQRDEQIFHILNVERGEDNHGGPVQTCETCHHEENNPYSNVPGAPHWGLAPKTMGWFGLSHAEIAERLLDPEMNGGRSHEDLIHHMSNDALILWAWDPGEGRTPPPVPHEEFVQALETWLDADAPIPGE